MLCYNLSANVFHVDRSGCVIYMYNVWMQHEGRAQKRIKRLEKIAREAGIFVYSPRYCKAFAECTTAKQKEKKLLQVLEDAGMHGTAAAAGALSYVMIWNYCVCNRILVLIVLIQVSLYTAVEQPTASKQ